MAGLFGSTTSAAASANPQGDLKNDVALNSPPEDGVSSIAFSSQSDHLAVGSWDKKVRIYEIKSDGSSEGKALFEHEGPVLDCCWSKDGQKVVGVGADKAARMIDLNTGQTQQVGAHDAPIKCCRMVEVQGTPVLATGGWDKKLKYWDLRSDQPVATVDCQEKVYSMDAKDKMMVVATAERYVNVVNLDNPTQWYKTITSPLKWQTRCVSCFTDATGYAVGSIEGRCAIQYVEQKDESSNFSFKCHRSTTSNPREPVNVYAVNSIRFHPQHGTFSTSGADGTFHFWDKDAKHRLKGFPEVGAPIVATDFNRTGSIFAYAISYDWSKGYSQNNPQLPIKVMLHPITGDECKPKPKAGVKK